MSATDTGMTWADLCVGKDFQGRAAVDFDAMVEHYLWGLAPNDEVMIKTTRRNALFYGLLAKSFMGCAAPEGGLSSSPYQQLHRLAYVLEFAAHHGQSDDTNNRGWNGAPTSRSGVEA